MARWRWLVAILLLIALLPAWIVWDLYAPARGSLYRFDAHAVARLETDMWRSYYDHRRLELLGDMARLLRTEYHLPFWRSWLGAWHAARAAVVFQRGRNREEYRRALPDIRAFYRLICAAGDVPFDVDTVSRLELEWWIVHRQRETYTPADLARALADLQAAIYGQPADRFEAHANARAEAMLLRDARAASGGVTTADWGRIEALLDDSWTSLLRAVSPQRGANE
jgi:hypothetical protein